MSKPVLRSHTRTLARRLGRNIGQKNATPKKRTSENFQKFLHGFYQKYNEFQKECRAQLYFQIFKHKRISRFYTFVDRQFYGYQIESLEEDFIVTEFKVEATKILGPVKVWKQEFSEAKQQAIGSSKQLLDPKTHNGASVKKINALATKYSKYLNKFVDRSRVGGDLFVQEATANKFSIMLSKMNQKCRLKCKTCGQLQPSDVHKGARPMSLDDEDEDDPLPDSEEGLTTFSEQRAPADEDELLFYPNFMRTLFQKGRELSTELEHKLKELGHISFQDLKLDPFILRVIKGADERPYLYEIKKKEIKERTPSCLQIPATKGVEEKIKIEIAFKKPTLLAWDEGKSNFQLLLWDRAEKEWQTQVLPGVGLQISDFAAVSFGDRIYMVGGSPPPTSLESLQYSDNGPMALDSIQYFDKKENQLITCENVKLKTAVRSPAAVIVGSKLLVTGGKLRRESMDKSMGTVQAFNFEFQGEKLILIQSPYSSSLHIPRNDHACVVWNDKAYVVGGSHFNEKTKKEEYLGSLEAIVPGAPYSWTSLVDRKMTTSRKNFAAVVLGDKLYVMGGWYKDVMLKSVECYDFIEKKWETKSEMNDRRAHCCATVWNGRIFVFGGWVYGEAEIAKKTDEQLLQMAGGEGYVRGFKVESFDPENDAWLEEDDYQLPENACNPLGVASFALL